MQRSELLNSLGVGSILGLGVTRVLSNVAKYWNRGLSMGTYPFVGMLAVEGLCFFLFSLCLAEISTALPFKGGIYGYARSILGPLSGYIVACLVLCVNLLTLAEILIGFAECITSSTGLSYEFQPLFWCLPLILYMSNQYSLQTQHAHSKQLTMTILSSIALFILAIFIFGGIQFLSKTNAAPISVSHPAQSVVDKLQYPSRLFIGLELIPIMAAESASPGRAVVIGLVGSMIIATVLSIIVALWAPFLHNNLAASSPTWSGGIVHSTNDHIAQSLPLSNGLSRILDISIQQASALSIPFFLASSLAACTLLNRCVLTMKESNLLLPKEIFHQPEISIVVFILIGTSIVFVLLIQESRSTLPYFDTLEALLVLSMMSVYATTGYVYLSFHHQFRRIKREFTSPVGTPGAYGTITLALGTSLAIITNPAGAIALALLGMFIACLVIFYQMKVKSEQKFSQEEQTVLLIAYVVHANRATRKKMTNKLPPAVVIASNVVASIINSSRGANRNNTSSPPQIVIFKSLTRSRSNPELNTSSPSIHATTLANSGSGSGSGDSLDENMSVNRKSLLTSGSYISGERSKHRSKPSPKHHNQRAPSNEDNSTIISLAMIAPATALNNSGKKVSSGSIVPCNDKDNFEIELNKLIGANNDSDKETAAANSVSAGTAQLRRQQLEANQQRRHQSTVVDEEMIVSTDTNENDRDENKAAEAAAEAGITIDEEELERASDIELAVKHWQPKPFYIPRSQGGPGFRRSAPPQPKKEDGGSGIDTTRSMFVMALVDDLSRMEEGQASGA